MAERACVSSRSTWRMSVRVDAHPVKGGRLQLHVARPRGHGRHELAVPPLLPAERHRDEARLRLPPVDEGHRGAEVVPVLALRGVPVVVVVGRERGPRPLGDRRARKANLGEGAVHGARALPLERLRRLDDGGPVVAVELLGQRGGFADRDDARVLHREGDGRARGRVLGPQLEGVAEEGVLPRDAAVARDGHLAARTQQRLLLPRAVRCGPHHAHAHVEVVDQPDLHRLAGGADPPRDGCIAHYIARLWRLHSRGRGQAEGQPALETAEAGPGRGWDAFRSVG